MLTDRGHSIYGIDHKNINDLDVVQADAAVIATPPDTHYPLAMRAMKNGMDVLVEKPMALKTSHACEMTDYALEHGLVLSVDSTFLHTQSAAHLLGHVGHLISYQSVRVAPPMVQAKVNAAWDLIVHDLSIIQRLAGVVVPGVGSVDGSVAQAAIPLPTGGSAFIMASRCWTHKVREIVLHYTHGTYLWTLDGLSLDGKRIITENDEPLRRLVMDFENRCQERSLTGLTDGLHGTEVVGCLERLFPQHSTIDIGPRKLGNGLYRKAPLQHLPM